MSSVATVVPLGDGKYEVFDWSFAPEEALDAFAAFRDAYDLSLDGPRGTIQAEHDLQIAADQCREICALRFDTLNDLRAFRDRLTKAIDNADRAQAEVASGRWTA